MSNLSIIDKFVCLFVLVCLLISPVYGDVVYLKNGDSFEGWVAEHNGKLKIVFQGGSVITGSENVERIEKKALAEEIFVGQLAGISGDADGCVKLAQWAFSRGMDKEYILALRAALLVDYEHSKARRLLRQYKRNHAYLPYNERAGRKILADMGNDFQLLRTDHFRICYDSADIFAEVTAERLEKIYEEFMLFFEKRNFEPAPLIDRLEVVLFDSAKEYHRYARKISRDMAYSSGFYSSRTGRSYFYDSISENNVDYQRNKEKLLKKGSESRQYIVTSSDGSEKKLNGREVLQELNQQKKLLDQDYAKLYNFYRNQNISVTVHEMTHQLAYNCGIHSKYFGTPRWLIEGLAMYFEAPDEDQWKQPGQLNKNRLERFVKANSSGQYITLKKLITEDDVFKLDKGRASDAYAAAWSLFYYLDYEQHKRLYDYVYNLSMKMSGKSYGFEERLGDFEKYFGHIGQLEHNWQGFMFDIASLRDG